MTRCLAAVSDEELLARSVAGDLQALAELSKRGLAPGKAEMRKLIAERGRFQESALEPKTRHFIR